MTPRQKQEEPTMEPTMGGTEAPVPATSSQDAYSSQNTPACCAPPCLCPTSSPSTPSACVSCQIIDFLLGSDGSFPMLLQAGLSNPLTPRLCACLCGAHLIISRTLCVLSHCHANYVQAQTVSCYPFASPQGPAKDWLMLSAQEAESHCRKLP